ncbi:type IX secretion system anionic LPS delivery protein PorZ [Psychroflexus sediminis]|uniref:Por secretion system C-terminal sorting domain-containing protein n=1 Tax=Psychroflexus sediminis TaxID=470826 RepID=A0A1G7X6T6_9FLAO|nr:T9SS type A sorting domain-containing protein [Psychroflexus sediminis]SDG79892.1 Por secretion system C-terminal sorting domain-containing protein [Psychroflexus sediminis]
MKAFSVLLLFFPCVLLAQDFSGQWKSYFSYYNITDLDESENKIYAAAENVYFVYDISSQTLETLTSIQGLSGQQISKIYHSETYRLTCIGYENGLLQIVMDNNQNIFTIVDIRDKISISPANKRINNFFEFEGILYIATDFGIAEYNLESLEFEESFFIGKNGGQIQVNQITISEGKIYAATTIEGIKTANIDDPNLIDSQNWLPEYPGNWRGVLSFSNQVFGLRNNNSIYRLENGSPLVFNAIGSDVTGFNVSGGQLMITAADRVLAYDSDLNLKAFINQIQDAEFNINTSVAGNGQYFLGHTRLGLLNFDSSDHQTYSEISPEGPLLNRIFSLNATPTDLWISFGEYSQFLNPYPLNYRGLSHLTPNGWINIQVEDLGNAAELSQVTIDPEDPKHVFVSSYFDGLLEIFDNQLVQIYDNSNSNLEGVAGFPDNNRIAASVFDNQNNLYFTDSNAPTPVTRLTPNGNIQKFEAEDGFLTPTETNTGKLVITQSGILFIATLKDGIVVFDTTTNQSSLITSNVLGVDFPDVFNVNPNITALEIDQNSRLWIGTQAGLRVLPNPNSIFDDVTRINVSPIIIEDVDGLPQELLFEQFITDIATDGANNKWIATADSGVFQVSPNGREILNIFNIENSPLPTNSVKTVAINQISGEVFFGTTSGLLSYSSKITAGNESLENLRAYPNPVRPSYKGLVTIDGLTDGANVKITDVTGNLVFEDFADGGTLQWDTRAFGKHRVASGVYLIIVTGEDQIENKVGKIMIIR